MMQASWAWWLYAGGWEGEVGVMGVRESERRCVQGGQGSEGEAGVTGTLAEEELVSMEWREVQEEDSESCGER